MKKTLKILFLAVFFSRLFFLSKAYAQQGSLILAPLIQDLEQEIRKQERLCRHLAKEYENILREKNVLEEEVKSEELKKQKQKELESLGNRLEAQRLQAEEKEKRLSAERQLEIELDMESARLNRHDRYVASLNLLLDRQEHLFKESTHLEQQIEQEELDLKKLRDNRQILLRKILEETANTNG